jgi:hypothetical protein
MRLTVEQNLYLLLSRFLLLFYAMTQFQVLNQLCDVIVEQLRDRVVTGLLQASLVIISATNLRMGFHN